MKPRSNLRMPRQDLDEWEVRLQVSALENVFEVSDRLVSVKQKDEFKFPQG